MANRTDPLAKTVHGTNPQFLIGKIVRSKIYDSAYWKEHCFGLTAASIIDRAIELTHVGGTYGGNRHATPFLCLVLKLLQIQPSHDIVVEYIKNEDFKYLRVLGAFYLRLTGSPQNVYAYLEPLLADYSKLRYRKTDGRVYLTHVDEIVDAMLRDTVVLEVDLPVLPSRHMVEETYGLPPKISILDEELEGEGASEQATGVGGGQELCPQKKQNGDCDASILTHDKQRANGSREGMRVEEEDKSAIAEGQQERGNNAVTEAKEEGSTETAKEHRVGSLDAQKDVRTTFGGKKAREGRCQDSRFRATSSTGEDHSDCVSHRVRQSTENGYDRGGRRREADVRRPVEDRHCRKQRRSLSRSQSACSVASNRTVSGSQRQRRCDWRKSQKEWDERHGGAHCYKREEHDAARWVRRSASRDSRDGVRRSHRRSSRRRSESRASADSCRPSSVHRSPYRKRSGKEQRRSKSLASEDGEWSIDDNESRRYGTESMSPSRKNSGGRSGPGRRRRSRQLARVEAPHCRRRQADASRSCVRSFSKSRSRSPLKRNKGIGGGVRKGGRERRYQEAFSSVSPPSAPRSCRGRFSTLRKHSPEKFGSSESVSRASRSLSGPRGPTRTKKGYASRSCSPV